MTAFLKTYSLLTLTFFAILAGLIWRIEVEYHGWKGLIWLSYYHIAIPITFFLFLIWANLSIRLKLTKRVGLNLIAIVLAFIVIIVLEQSFRRMFISGPAAFFYFFGEDPLGWLIYAPYFVVALLPISIALFSRIFGIVCKPLFVILGTLIMAISPDICVFLLELFKDKGSPNYIHTIKSGYLMTFWFFSIGFVFISHSIRSSSVNNVPNSKLVDTDL